LFNMSIHTLPDDCLSLAISFTSPLDACRSSAACTGFREAADSDATWEKFLPSDYKEIISRTDRPVAFSSKKELFLELSSAPLIIDGGTKSFMIDKKTGKKCYMLSPKELSISWSCVPQCWCWKPLLNSRFPIGVELIVVSWLQIKGRINTTLLSPNTAYGVYLVFQLSHRTFGFEHLPAEAEIQAGDDFHSQRSIPLGKNGSKGKGDAAEAAPSQQCLRDDGWTEVEMGEFYTNTKEMEVTMEFRETKGMQLKGGLILEGIEIRPK
ncbi:hypothetical protein M569_07943, partial [Genlisea aurea]